MFVDLTALASVLIERGQFSISRFHFSTATSYLAAVVVWKTVFVIKKQSPLHFGSGDRFVIPSGSGVD